MVFKKIVHAKLAKQGKFKFRNKKKAFGSLSSPNAFFYDIAPFFKAATNY
ncbi:hypothetical protein NCCP28_00460 [Niallia sp. NCCP-28]|nr:hypothetical protein NCCP28_00460 [Niallia sp. NCCP-28]